MGKVRRLLQREDSSIGIRNKLLVCFLLLSVFPALFIAVSNFGVSKDILEDKTSRYSHDILLQSAKSVGNRLDKIEDISFNIFIDTNVQSMLLEARKGDLDEYEASRITTSMESILKSQVLYHNEIDAIFLMSVGGYVYQLDKTKQGYGLMDERIDEIYDAQGSVLWYGGLENDRAVALTRAINSVTNQKPLGYMVSYIDIGYLFDVLSDTQSVMNGDIYIVDAEGIIVVDSKRERIGTYAAAMQGDSFEQSYSFSIREIDGREQYLSVSETMDNGWRIVLSVPVSTYQKEIIQLRNIMLLLTGCLFIITIYVAWRMSGSMSRPIQELTSAMTRFGDGDLSVRCETGTNDEIGKCAAAFTDMAENINTLINKVYEEELMKRDAELKSLQMQINPHFLYNTLDTMNWMARMNGLEDVGIMAKSLADLMRSTIDAKDYVLLREEIASLKSYLQIQQYRYGDKMNSIFDIAPETMELYVPKLIIQPSVENAIYHGIVPSFDGGNIVISSRLEENMLHISVTDDCVGMTEEMIKRVTDLTDMSVYTQGKHHSIGLKNVIKRIKTLFGDAYGIDIFSELGEGTNVVIRIPILKNEPK